ncbi:Uncharacterised protein [uncultured archaeon]|nr:Uncharacterised protein [uncultured archaeon]
MKRVMKNKKGLSTIVVTLILVVLSLVAVGVVWAVISNLLKTGEEQSTSSFGQIFLNLKVQNVNIKSNGDVDVTVQRNSGAGDLKAINFIVSDGTNTQVIKQATSLSELGTQTFTLPYSTLGSMAIKTVSIAPVINTNGQETVGNVIDKYVNTNSGTYLYGPTNSPVWNDHTVSGGYGTYTNNNVVAPDGTMTGSTLTLTATAWDLYQPISPTPSGTVYTFSAYVKLGTATNFCVVMNNQVNWNTVLGKCFSAADGLSTTQWTRVYFTFTAPATNAINFHVGAHAENLPQQTAGTVNVWNWEIINGKHLD